MYDEYDDEDPENPYDPLFVVADARFYLVLVLAGAGLETNDSIEDPRQNVKYERQQVQDGQDEGLLQNPSGPLQQDRAEEHGKVVSPCHIVEAEQPPVEKVSEHGIFASHKHQANDEGRQEDDDAHDDESPEENRHHGAAAPQSDSLRHGGVFFFQEKKRRRASGDALRRYTHVSCLGGAKKFSPVMIQCRNDSHIMLQKVYLSGGEAARYTRCVSFSMIHHHHHQLVTVLVLSCFFHAPSSSPTINLDLIFDMGLGTRLPAVSTTKAIFFITALLLSHSRRSADTSE